MLAYEVQKVVRIDEVLAQRIVGCVARLGELRGEKVSEAAFMRRAMAKACETVERMDK